MEKCIKWWARVPDIEKYELTCLVISEKKSYKKLSNHEICKIYKYLFK